MRLLRSRRAAPDRALHHRLVRQSASLLLAYPDEGHRERLGTVDQFLEHMTGPEKDMLATAARELGAKDLLSTAQQYVETFDLRRRSTMYLTYWTSGDTRNRGAEMHTFASVYRAAGVVPPAHESPDHLPVVLEFTANVDPASGEELLTRYRPALDVLHASLRDARSPYAQVVAAVCATLPPATDQEEERARRLAQAGPPRESIGLQPFTLTVPPRTGRMPPKGTSQS
ncbi:nitrate reductase molybdenum cofactor assembly chaperone [Rhodococcus gordoniae]|uniref:nitrate reductase molybdenum cofactor assembly chaperone n=1 Tax=Rhodococcus gordoniae TaxID=223392 RepID=UPI0020CD5EFF|nr:nitrate reductase molybdenum cofactor assembly chaperone [Rhodococcus gordoniae]UTT50237.1 nitrate reductase molybdenum cofactor assembly chaperone [Rhodococcus gordoniae]